MIVSPIILVKESFHWLMLNTDQDHDYSCVDNAHNEVVDIMCAVVRSYRLCHRLNMALLECRLTFPEKRRAANIAQK